ncbi:hypothetical protein Nepgr_017381 [Nepenthes gracilis]|uniref:Uncharacterized protein n=1 Tax=Nepenthes gracilis TaxID=150966 RepID=A0AAD3XTB7_NEPGR|nr:hypothetical protein Nepgr_017381 [Nepenthes gracilis]
MLLGADIAAGIFGGLVGGSAEVVRFGLLISEQNYAHGYWAAEKHLVAVVSIAIASTAVTGVNFLAAVGSLQRRLARDL